MAANDDQVGGEHYKTMAIQPWDFIESNGLSFLEGCIIKYVARWRRKKADPTLQLEDLHKARHFLNKLIEVEERKLLATFREAQRTAVPAVSLHPDLSVVRPRKPLTVDWSDLADKSIKPLS